MSRGQGPALLAILALLTFLPAPSNAASSAEQLIKQLESRGIRSPRVLDAFRRVPRAVFAPATVRDRANDDAPLEIGHGQTMSQPYVVALMTEELGLDGDERVLEIGTGSGYQTAILATVAHDVYSVEIVPELASSARLRLSNAGYRNVHVKQGDGNLGWREYGPYDAVVVTAAAPAVPRALIEQLREGGVLVMPLGEAHGRQVLVRGVKRGTKLRTKEIGEVRFVPLLRGDGTGAVRTEPGASADASEADQPRRKSSNARENFDDDAPAMRGNDERPRPAPPSHDLNEEDLPERDGSSPESDRRLLPGARNRAARAPSVPRSDRRCEVRVAACVGVGFPAASRRSAA